MNGNNRLLLDTNAFIYFFEGRSKITDLVVQTPIIYYSVISKIELLSSPRLNENEAAQIKSFLSLCQQVDLNAKIVEQTIAIRQSYRFKIPDAIIISSALMLNIPLVSADTAFRRASKLTLITDILT